MDGSYVTKTLHPVVTSDLISRSKIKRESKKKTSMAEKIHNTHVVSM